MIMNDDILTRDNAIPIGTPVEFILAGVGKVIEFIEKPFPESCYYKVKVTESSFFYDLGEVEIFFHKQIKPITNEENINS